MDFKKYFKVLPAVAAMFFAVSCSNDKEIVSEPQGLVIPFEATVSSSMQTRAELNDGYTAYQFQAGDKLWVYGTKISGELTLKASDAGKTSNATFEGSLTYTGGEGSPASDLNLYAILKGADDVLLPASLASFMLSPSLNYTDAIAADPNEAVQKYGLFATLNPTTFGNKNFTLYQMSSFLVFDITLKDGTAAGETVSPCVNDANFSYTKEVTTVSEGGAVRAKFTAAFLGKRTGLSGLLAPLSLNYTTLNGAEVTFDGETSIPFGGDDSFPLVSNTFYRVNKVFETYTVTASYGDNSVDVATHKTLPYNTDLTEVMEALGPTVSANQDKVTNCTLKSGSSISIGEFDAVNHNCVLSALESGTSVATMTLDLGLGFPVSGNLTIKVVGDWEIEE